MSCPFIGRRAWRAPWSSFMTLPTFRTGSRSSGKIISSGSWSIALVISLTTLLLIRWSIAGPIAKMAEWMKHLRTEKNKEPLRLPSGGVFEPLTREVAHMARSISAAREAAEEEARLRNIAESTWTPARLNEQVRSLLQERPLFVISNREPYLHEKKGKED